MVVGIQENNIKNLYLLMEVALMAKLDLRVFSFQQWTFFWL